MRYLLPLAFAGLAFAQLDPYTLTVTASRAVTTTPDQVSFAIGVNSPQNASLSDVLTLVQGVGLTQANLIGAITFNGATNPKPLLEWTFSTTVSYSGMKDAIAKFNALQAAAMKKNSPFDVNFQVTGVQTSPQALAAQTCPMATLVADARAQAQALAQAAGFGLGSISTITDLSGVAVTQGVSTIGYAAFYPSSPSLGGGAIGLATSLLLAVQSGIPNTCTIVVKFKLTLS